MSDPLLLTHALGLSQASLFFVGQFFPHRSTLLFFSLEGEETTGSLIIALCFPYCIFVSSLGSAHRSVSDILSY